MIGRSGERRSGISVLAARHHDDYDIYTYMCACRGDTAKWHIIPCFIQAMLEEWSI